jgi:hypothetical protein
MRYAIRIDPWWLPLLLPLGVWRTAAYVEVDATGVRVRFGLFHFALERSRIVGARPVAGAGLWGMGIGVHTNFVNALAVNGSLAGVVELWLEPPQRLRVLLVPVRYSRLYLSLEDPEAFLRALGLRAPAGAR